MPLLEAMDQGKWNAILCLHENVATGAADGFSRMGFGRCMVLLHLGPGVANGLTNIHNAVHAGSEMLLVAGEIATSHQGKGSVLETDIYCARSGLMLRTVLSKLLLMCHTWRCKHVRTQA
jgi:acetolactate synthase-1/2/3 large subunit